MGLLIAVFLGVLGGVLNLIYLNRGGDRMETEYFLGVKKGADIKRGEPFKENHFEPVSIPAQRADNLKPYAVLYSDLNAVVGQRSLRNIDGDVLLLHSDWRNAPQVELELAAGETAVFVPVDTRTFVESLVVPGETPVQFLLPSESGTLQKVGPFEVISVGNRMGSLETAQAEKLAQRNQNVLTIRGTPQNREQVEQLQLHLIRTNKRPLDVDVLPKS